jgi:hypothetical protein
VYVLQDEFDLEEKHWDGVLLRRRDVFVYNLFLIVMGNISFLNVVLLYIEIPSLGRYEIL